MPRFTVSDDLLKPLPFIGYLIDIARCVTRSYIAQLRHSRSLRVSQKVSLANCYCSNDSIRKSKLPALLPLALTALTTLIPDSIGPFFIVVDLTMAPGTGGYSLFQFCGIPIDYCLFSCLTTPLALRRVEQLAQQLDCIDAYANAVVVTIRLFIRQHKGVR